MSPHPSLPCPRWPVQPIRVGVGAASEARQEGRLTVGLPLATAGLSAEERE